MTGLGYAFTWLKAMAVGAWKVEPVVGAMPQKVATAVGELGETMLGAKYEPIAYLGSQLANGVNHAVLAKQTIVAGVDTVNVVLLKFSEKEMDCSLYAVEPVMQGGAAFGGFTVDPKAGKDIPEDAMKTFKDVTEGWVGVKLDPIALLGSKVTKGVDLVFLAKVTPVYPDAEATAKLVVVNGLTKTIDFVDVL